MGTRTRAAGKAAIAPVLAAHGEIVQPHQSSGLFVLKIHPLLPKDIKVSEQSPIALTITASKQFQFVNFHLSKMKRNQHRHSNIISRSNNKMIFNIWIASLFILLMGKISGHELTASQTVHNLINESGPKDVQLIKWRLMWALIKKKF